jgi:hypothetical protein
MNYSNLKIVFHLGPGVLSISRSAAIHLLFGWIQQISCMARMLSIISPLRRAIIHHQRQVPSIHCSPSFVISIMELCARWPMEIDFQLPLTILR